MLDAIHHIAIIASDYAASRRFYVETLGLTVIREEFRAERGSWKCDLAIGQAQIELFSFPDPPPRVTNPEARGLRHLAFAVAALDPVLERLAAAGIPVESVRIDAQSGARFTFFRDPDDLPLELYETAGQAARPVS